MANVEDLFDDVPDADRPQRGLGKALPGRQQEQGERHVEYHQRAAATLGCLCAAGPAAFRDAPPPSEWHDR